MAGRKWSMVEVESWWVEIEKVSQNAGVTKVRRQEERFWSNIDWWKSTACVKEQVGKEVLLYHLQCYNPTYHTEVYYCSGRLHFPPINSYPDCLTYLMCIPSWEIINNSISSSVLLNANSMPTPTLTTSNTTPALLLYMTRLLHNTPSYFKNKPQQRKSYGVPMATVWWLTF